MDKALKGSLEGVLPMTGLLILAAILATQSLPVSEALASVLDESSQEISAISENNANTDHITETYIPDSMKYSVNNAAYELDEGGINWESEASSASDPSWILGSVVSAWREEASNNFNDRIDEVSCSIDEGLNYRIYPQASNPSFDFYSRDFENVTVLSEDSTGLKIACKSVSDQRTGTYTEIVSTPNRYIELAKATSTFFFDVEEEFSSASVSSSYSASGYSCGSSSEAYRDARDSAYSSYTSDTPSVSSIASSISLPDGLDTDTSQDDEYTVTDTDPSSGGCCDYECASRNENGTCTSYVCDDYSQYDDVTISPTETVIDFEIMDQELEVVTEDSYQNLEIDVNNYEFSH